MSIKTRKHIQSFHQLFYSQLPISRTFPSITIGVAMRKSMEKHGLDGAMIANDDKALEELGPDRGLLAIGEKVSGMNGWGSAKLDSVGRNKIHHESS